MSQRANNNGKTIGIFDSGIGGLTVTREIFKQLPHEDIIYFGDTGRYPYGPRSADIIKKFSRQNVNFLFEKGVKFIIVACNTASSYALDYIEKIYNIPMIGVVKPGAEAAAHATKNKKVGVIGTQGTISSGSYQKALMKVDKNLTIWSLACPLFVALAEEGYVNKPAARLIAKDYLSGLKKKSIDSLILGCTHYPLLKSTIKHTMGPNLRLIDSAEQTAKAAKTELIKLGLINPKKSMGKKEFYVSDSPDKFKKLGERFLGRKIGKVKLVDISSY